MRQPSVELEGSKLNLTFPYDPNMVVAIRSIGGARWEPTSKSWSVPYSDTAMTLIKRLFPSLLFGPKLKQVEGAGVEDLLVATERKYLPLTQDFKITDFEFATEPYWHQCVTFNFARALDCSALFLEQGLGKAKIYIDLMTWRFRQGQVKRVLVVCPNSVCPQWRVEVRKHGHADFNKVLVLEGSTRDKIAQLSELPADWAGFVVVNYDALLGMYEYLMERQDHRDPFARLFQAIGLDESSRIKHATSKRSKICWKLGQTVKYRNILTGTPVTQSLEDIFAQYRFLKSEIFGVYTTAFRALYLIMGGFEQRQVIGYRNIDEALRKVYSVAIRFTAERCLDLPPKVYEKRYARLDEATSKQYRTLEKECVAEFGDRVVAAPLVMTKLMKLSQVVGGFIYEQGPDGKRIGTHILPKNPKLEVLQELLEGREHSKTIIWCHFKQEILMIQDLLSRLRLGYVAIHGDVPSAERGEAVRRFQEDSTIQVFLGQVSTAGLGITLTAADTVVYYSNTYSLEDRLQSEARAHRIGQTKTVRYVDIVAEGVNGGRTIDHDVLAVLTGKNSFAEEVSLALMSRMVQREKASRNPAHIKRHVKDDDAFIEAEEAF